MDDLIQSWYDSLDEEGRYLFDERAAIIEFDHRKKRDFAEMIAYSIVKREIDSESSRAT